MSFYGLMGAHRTGKTTLGQDLSQALQLPFVKTDISGAMKDLGLSPQDDLPFSLRLEVQELLLQCLVSTYAKAKAENPHAPLILVDRTPLDILSYTYTDVSREAMKAPGIADLMAAHERRCVEATNFSFEGLCLVQIGIPLVEDPNKAPANPYYQRHVHAQMLDAAYRLDVDVPTWILNQRNVDRKSRVSEISKHISDIITSRELHNSAPQPVRLNQSLH